MIPKWVRIEYIQYKNINEIFYSPFFILGLWNSLCILYLEYISIWMSHVLSLKSHMELVTTDLGSTQPKSQSFWVSLWWESTSHPRVSAFFLVTYFLKVFTEFVTILLLFYVLFFGPWGPWDLSFLTRSWTHTTFIGRQVPNHWTAREVPVVQFLVVRSTWGDFQC